MVRSVVWPNHFFFINKYACIGSQMRNFNLLVVVLFSICLMVSAGCGNRDYELADVEGKVTYGGKAVPKLHVTFSPEIVGKNLAVGPFSHGTTDEEGKFSLYTRNKEYGAVVGKHKLSFEYSDIGESAMADLVSAMKDAEDSGSKEELSDAKSQIAELQKKLKGRPVLHGFEVVVDVPSGGLENYELDLAEYETKK